MESGAGVAAVASELLEPLQEAAGGICQRQSLFHRVNTRTRTKPRPAAGDGNGDSG